jgi:hypothetical protein
MPYDLALLLVLLMLCYCLCKVAVSINKLVNVLDIHTKQVRMIHDDITGD